MMATRNIATELIMDSHRPVCTCGEEMRYWTSLEEYRCIVCGKHIPAATGIGMKGDTRQPRESSSEAAIRSRAAKRKEDEKLKITKKG